MRPGRDTNAEPLTLIVNAGRHQNKHNIHLDNYLIIVSGLLFVTTEHYLRFILSKFSKKRPEGVTK